MSEFVNIPKRCGLPLGTDEGVVPVPSGKLFSFHNFQNEMTKGGALFNN